jgi:hypothetical protein
MSAAGYGAADPMVAVGGASVGTPVPVTAGATTEVTAGAITEVTAEVTILVDRAGAYKTEFASHIVATENFS